MGEAERGTDHDGEGAEVSAAELERERLRSYLDWGEVKFPVWWVPTYAALIAVWIASYDLGRGWGTAAAVVFAAAMGLLIGVAVARTGVSTPRFRGMPSPLRRTFLIPLGTLAVGVLAALAVTGLVEVPFFTSLGVGVGVGLGCGLEWQGRRYRTAARRIAAARGIRR